MDNSQTTIKLYSLEETIDEFIPKGSPEREIFDLKSNIVERLQKMIKGHKYVKTDEGKVFYFNREIKKLIDEIE